MRCVATEVVMPEAIGRTKAARFGVARRLQRLTRMYAALSATNETILRTRSPEELYQQVCEAALNGGNFVGTAVLLSESRSDLLRFAAGAGHGIERLRSIDISTAE